MKHENSHKVLFIVRNKFFSYLSFPVNYLTNLFVCITFRDMFIEEHMKPKLKVISESNLEWLFDMDDGAVVSIFS